MRSIFTIFLFLLFFFSQVSAELKLTPILDNLNKPWSITIKDQTHYLITEKSGNILIFNNVNNKHVDQLKYAVEKENFLQENLIGCRG